MTITIDEAIEELRDRILPPELKCDRRFTDAVQLGIEALKAWRDRRLYSSHLAYHLLPGETRNRKGG